MKLRRLALCIFLVTGCTVGPNYQKPKVIEESWPVIGVDIDTQTSMANLHWREFYPETELQALIERALLHNISLKRSLSSVVQSRNIKGITDNALLPSLGVVMDGERESESGLTNEVPEVADEFNLNFGARWEVDFWGKLGRASESSLATYQANKANLYAAKISLIAQVATLYYQIQDVSARVLLTEQNIESRSKSKHIAVLRHKQGVISGLDVRQAEVELAQEAIKIPALNREKNTLMYQLSLLLGEVPKQQIIGSRASSFTYQNSIPAGITSQLLKRRPDIISAERKMQAANALIGVETANYYPNIALTGQYGFSTEAFTDLLKSNGSTWLVNAEINMPLWDWGTIELKVENAKANYEMTVLEYKQQILMALSDVFSAIEYYQEAFEVYELRQTLVLATKENLRIAKLRYQNGVVNYLAVLDAQRSHSSAEQELSRSIEAKQISMVNLYRSLGGGWDPIEKIYAKGILDIKEDQLATELTAQ